MRTYSGIKLSAFEGEQRDAMKIVDDMLRMVSGGLSRSILPGQSPAANIVPSLSNPTGSGGSSSSTPTAAQGDLLYGLSNGTWTKLTIGTAGQFLTVSGGIPSWSNTFSGALTVTDSLFSITDNVTPSKVLQFQCSGISASTTRTVTVQDASGTMPLLQSTQTFTAPQTIDPTAGDALTIIPTDAVGTKAFAVRNAANTFDRIKVNHNGIFIITDVWDLHDAAFTGFICDFVGDGGWTADQGCIIPNLGGVQKIFAFKDLAQTWTALQTFKDTTWKIVDDGDASKTAAFSLGGASANADLTIAWNGTADRTITIPNETSTLATRQGDNTFTGINIFPATPGGGGAGATLPGLFLADGSGFTVELAVLGAGLTADRTARFPDGSGDVMLTGAAQTVSSKTFTTTGNTLRASNASTGVAFEDQTTTSKKLRMVLSGASASTNTALSFTSTASRTFTYTNDDATLVGNVGESTLTGQTGSVGATTLRTTTHAGLYRVSVYAVFTAVTTPGTLTLTANWTDPQQAQTDTINLLGTGAVGANAYAVAGDFFCGEIIVRATSGSAIQYATTLTGTGTYNVYAVCEALTNS